MPVNYRPTPKTEPGPLLPETISFLQNQVVKARTKHPGNKLMLAALMEEVGELAKGICEGHARRELIMEAYHIAVVALRIAEEGGI